MYPAPDLSRLLLPRSVAIVGASSNPDSISGRPFKLLRRFGYQGAIYLVNPTRSEIDGHPCWPDVASLPETPDVVLIGIRADRVEAVIDQAVARGVPFGIIFSSGFAESDDAQAQRRLVEKAASGGMRLLGPNCQGLVNLADRVPLSFSASLDTDRTESGPVAYVSQSGAFGFASYAMAADQGVGFRYVVTTGNQADLDVIDFGRHFAADPEVGLLVLYLEGLSRGEAFLDLLEEASRRDLPVAVLKAGRSATAQAAARSHTAALTGDQASWDAVMRQYRVLAIDDAEDLVDLGRVFSRPVVPGGNRVAILTTSGGGGIMMADQCDDQGLAVEPFSDALQAKIAPYLPSFGSTRNPVDMTAQVINDPEGFPACLEAVLESDETDLVVVVISMITGDAGRKMASDLARAARGAKKPVLCCWMINDEQGGAFLEYLRRHHVPLFQSPRRCARALGALYRWSTRRRQPRCLTEGLTSYLDRFPEKLTEYDAKRLLALHGVPVTKERLCASLDEALAAADEIGFPLALKVMSPDILHKTEARIVALRLRDREELQNAYGRLLERAVLHDPKASILGVLVQEMVEGGLECMIGMRRDPSFGPMVAVGLGGIYVEVLKDLSLRHAPLTEEMALEMIGELKGYPLLKGVRGEPGRDVTALAGAVAAVSRMACAESDLLELDVNPLFVLPEGRGVLAADALVIRRS
ncbi:MAG: acetate--CoA ligase family protein [Synergistaceae bacterium]|jgi:acyl-CoA synthetase (NDP forming)|nr:acetate--CoA ligase family protein [Synergistaceae bacterium]